MKIPFKIVVWVILLLPIIFVGCHYFIDIQNKFIYDTFSGFSLLIKVRIYWILSSVLLIVFIPYFYIRKNLLKNVKELFKHSLILAIRSDYMNTISFKWQILKSITAINAMVFIIFVLDWDGDINTRILSLVYPETWIKVSTYIIITIIWMTVCILCKQYNFFTYEINGKKYIGDNSNSFNEIFYFYKTIAEEDPSLFKKNLKKWVTDESLKNLWNDSDLRRNFLWTGFHAFIWMIYCADVVGYLWQIAHKLVWFW